jgi:hypothetical protein
VVGAVSVVSGLGEQTAQRQLAVHLELVWRRRSGRAAAAVEQHVREEQEEALLETLARQLHQAAEPQELLPPRNHLRAAPHVATQLAQLRPTLLKFTRRLTISQQIQYTAAMLDLTTSVVTKILKFTGKNLLKFSFRWEVV